jgi:hypothetical protein
MRLRVSLDIERGGAIPETRYVIAAVSRNCFVGDAGVDLRSARNVCRTMSGE